MANVLSNFNQNWIFLDTVIKANPAPQIPNFTEIRPGRAALVHSDRRIHITKVKDPIAIANAH